MGKKTSPDFDREDGLNKLNYFFMFLLFRCNDMDPWTETSQQILYRRIFRKQHLLPLTDYRRHIEYARKIIRTIRRLHTSKPQIDLIDWYLFYFAVVLSHAVGLARKNDMAFVKTDIDSRECHTNLIFLPDWNKRLIKWIRRCDHCLDSTLKAIENNDDHMMAICFDSILSIGSEVFFLYRRNNCDRKNRFHVVK